MDFDVLLYHPGSADNCCQRTVRMLFPLPKDFDLIMLCSAALFALFTNALVLTHVLLSMKGQSTVESMMVHSTKERESAALRKEYGLSAWR